MSFKVNEKMMAVLKNFSQINVQVCIEADKVEVINGSFSVIGSYKFDEPLPITKELGIYELNEFIAVMSAYKNPDITEHDKFIVISEGSSKMKYWINAKSMLPKILIQNKYTPADIRERLDSVGCELEFVLPAERLNMLMKMASLIKAEWIFFESVDGKIRITIGDALESSHNTWEMEIDSDIKSNTLTKPMKCNMGEFRVMSSDYNVRISSKGMSIWKNALGVEYFIGCAAV